MPWLKTPPIYLRKKNAINPIIEWKEVEFPQDLIPQKVKRNKMEKSEINKEIIPHGEMGDK